MKKSSADRLYKIGLLGFIICLGFSITKGVAQTNQISGRVTDVETGRTMPGVNVVVVGTSIGAATDNKGQYILEVPADADSLAFSFIGYETQHVAITGQSVINVALVPRVQTFEEVVVTALGIEQQQRSLGYSV